MKFLLFADLHHAPGKYPSGTWEHLGMIQKHAEDENVDFIIHAGDFCFAAGEIPEFVEAYNNFHIPSYHVLGNHDADRTPLDEVLKLYRMPGEYYYFDNNGYRIIALSPNYYKHEGKYYAYDRGNYYKFGPDRDWLPPEQLEWLEKTIADSPYPCILISHESFEREEDGVKNQMEVRKIINDANKRRPHSVLMCINGHYHRDFLRILDNVLYFDVNAVSFEFINQPPHNLYPKEFHEKWPAAKYSVLWEDPLHCIVTIEGNTITIDGMESKFLYGVTREMTGQPPNPSGRACTPKIQSAKITLE